MAFQIEILSSIKMYVIYKELKFTKKIFKKKN